MSTPETKPQAEFDFADWVAQGIRGVRQSLQAEARPCRLLPDAFGEHVRASRREALLALRSLVDVAIECLQPSEQETAEQGPRRSRVTKIEVQESRRSA